MNIYRHRERLLSFKTKNKKVATLVAKHGQSYLTSSYLTPFINLSWTMSTTEEVNQFKFGLQHSFVDKNKHIKKYLVINLE